MRWVSVAAALAVLAVPVVGQAQPAVGAASPHPVIMPARPSQPSGSAAPATSSSVGLLTYHGGPVAHNLTVSLDFWQPPGWVMSTGYQSLIARWVTDLSGSTVYAITGEYPDKTGTPGPKVTLGSVITDTRAFPGGRGPENNMLQDGDIQAEVTASKLTSDTNHLVVVLLPKDAWLNAYGAVSFRDFCAYHYAFPADIPTSVYAAMPYVGTSPASCENSVNGQPPAPNANPDADNEISVVSHELFESVTDPVWTCNSSGCPYTGWYFGDTSHEIGDQCNFVLGPTDSTGGDIVLNGHHYVMQKEWSNASARAFGVTQAGGCTLAERQPTVMWAATVKGSFGKTTMTAKLTTKTGTPLVGRRVTMTSGNSALCAALTNTSGIASCATNNGTPIVLNKGYTATFAGDTTYLGSSAHGGVN